MSALAGPKWSNLPEAEKAAYNLKAKHEKRNASILESSLPKHSPGRLDSAGELISVIIDNLMCVSIVTDMYRKGEITS
jgi:hypothetical protein